MEVHEEGDKGLMDEGGTYSVLGVLIDEGKWYLWCVECDVESLVGQFKEVEVA